MNDTFNLEIEAALICECLSNNQSIDKLKNLGIEEKDFYRESNRQIYKAILNAYKKYSVADIVFVNKCGIPISTLAEYMNVNIGKINVKAYAKELRECRYNRDYLEIAVKMADNKLENPSKAIADIVESKERFNQKMFSENTIITIDTVNMIDIYRAEKVKSGIDFLDKKILGFMFGTLVVITGYNGAGKSTLINQMCISESIRQGYKVFAYSPELTNSTLKSWLYPTIALSHDYETKTSHEGIEYKTVTQQGIKRIDNWIKDKLYIYSDDSITNDFTRIYQDMLYMVEKLGVRVFIIDNLMKLNLSAISKDKLEAQGIVTNILKEFARKYNCIVHLVAHLRKPDKESRSMNKYEISGNADITNLADYVIGVARVYDEMREKNPSLKDGVIKLMKDRPTGNQDIITDLFFDKNRRRFYCSNSDLNKDYGYCSYKDFIEVENEDMNIPF